jgi:hypothetical protein
MLYSHLPICILRVNENRRFGEACPMCIYMFEYANVVRLMGAWLNGVRHGKSPPGGRNDEQCVRGLGSWPS